MQLFNLFSSLLRWICANVKHAVIAYAHPPPASIVVYEGRPGGIHHAIVHAVVSSVDIPVCR